MNTEDNNKMIAEFMGYPELGTEGDFSYLKYHKDWNWLMPVVEKCLIGEAEHTEERFINAISNIYESICSQDIYQTHESVVEFIKQLNKWKYKTCDRCSYDILDKEGDVLEHHCIDDEQ